MFKVHKLTKPKEGTPSKIKKFIYLKYKESNNNEKNKENKYLVITTITIIGDPIKTYGIE